MRLALLSTGLGFANFVTERSVLWVPSFTTTASSPPPPLIAGVAETSNAGVPTDSANHAPAPARANQPAFRPWSFQCHPQIVEASLDRAMKYVLPGMSSGFTTDTAVKGCGVCCAFALNVNDSSRVALFRSEPV